MKNQVTDSIFYIGANDHDIDLFEGHFDVPLGILKPGAHADVIITDYDPLTPMGADNVTGHIVFGMNGRSVVTTMCAGRVLMKERVLTGIDEAAVMAACRESAGRLARAVNA